MEIAIYTDGSATTIDKPGGYGYVIVIDGKKHSEGSGYMPNATNNDAEMQAAIEGLRALSDIKQKGLLDQLLLVSEIPVLEITVKSDSQLILGWISGQYRFKQQNKLDKYQELRNLSDAMQVKTQWVKGHNGDEHNERCDKLANMARLQKQEELDTKDAKERGDTLIGTKKTGIMCVWYKGVLKIIDLDKNITENYNRDSHGPRGSRLEMLEEKRR